MEARFRRNVDHTCRISKSIFVTNFPDSTTSNDLWKLCQGYGTVVDVYIPNRKSKAGKRFAFVRFIKVENVDRLVGNLCTLWIGRMHLHANVVRFERSPIQSSRPIHPISPANSGAPSFASALKALGEVKQFSSINNLHVFLSNEGFPNVKLAYLGGLWVMIELESLKTKMKFMQHVGVASWFLRLCNAQSDFVLRERIVWVDIEGVPIHAWSHLTFHKIGSKWGEVMELEECKDDMFARKRICIKTKQEDNILEKFKIIVHRKIFVVRAKELFVWSPIFNEVKEVVYCTDDESIKGGEENNEEGSKQVNLDDGSDVEGVSETYFGEAEDNLVNDNGVVKSGVDTSIPFPPGFMPEKDNKTNEEQEVNGTDSAKPHSRSDDFCSRVVEDAQSVDEHLSADTCLGSKAKKDWARELNIKYKVSFLTLQETKMESIFVMDVKTLWGNYCFEYLFSEALGNSGGILCAWDPNIFHKDQHIISDNFVALYGIWKPTKTKILLISIYAPQAITEKRSIWCYITSLITRWDGDCIVMGDFNKVMYMEERMGLTFNTQGANEFNNFIFSSGLVDVQLEGYSFTWSHPSGAKMSKLDRFLVTEGLVSSFTHISAICLDRHLSDHRPILLRDVITDYGATLFRFYHSWLDGVNDELLLSRKDLMKQMQDIKSSEARDCIMVDGEWVDDPNRVKEEFCLHFAMRFQAPVAYRSRLNFQFPYRLNNEQAADLENSITQDEIRNAVWGYGENKSPGPDGFTFEFFRKFWNVIGADVCVAVEWFFDHSSFSKGCNSSFVALIPKIQDPKFVNDYRPISLIGSLYKVVTKVLANRLSSVISDLISDVQTALFSGMASILINGSPTFEFQFHCGLKQGGPLTPYLFILVMESLHLSFSRVVDAGVGVPHALIIEAAMALGCSVMRTPFKYLGVVVGGNMSLIKPWDEKIGKLKSRLSRWKLNALSIGGWLTLLKSVLGSTSIYTMSLYKVPKFVLNLMESIRRNFFNGIHGAEKKISWVKWSKVFAAKKNGGLGVSSYYALNRALLFKWVWRFISQDNSLWFRVITSIHGSQILQQSSCYSSNWNSIIREMQTLKSHGVDLFSHCRIHVVNKECSVADKLQGSVTTSFRRSARGGIEAHQLAQLQLLIEPTILSNSDDRWVWDLNGDGIFRVKDVRCLLDEFFLPKDITATRWVKTIPIKINVFAWKVCIDRLPTRMNLFRRDVQVPSLLCPICNDAPEDTSHLFFNCALAIDVTRLVCRWWDLVWTPLGSYSEWLSWFKSIRLGSKIKGLLEGVFYVTWWSLWNFRNTLLFADQSPRKDVIFDDIVTRSFTWCLARSNSSFSWDSWLQHPYLISM
ncbi:RNA-directed DNA polymerase, eukaryota [Tanacetum coccineum]